MSRISVFTLSLVASIGTLGFSLIPAANAATFNGLDAGVGVGGARPNSDTAQSNFLAAASLLNTVQTIDFEDLSIGDFNNQVVAPGVSVELVDDSDTDSGITNSNSTTLGYNTTNLGSQHLRLSPTSGDGVVSTATFSFDDPINSFGAYFTGVGTTAGDLQLLFDDGSTQMFDITGSSGGGVLYFGVTDSTAMITQIVVSYTDADTAGVDVLGIDDVSFTLAIPEPATLIGFVISGLCVTSIRLRRMA